MPAQPRRLLPEEQVGLEGRKGISRKRERPSQVGSLDTADGQRWRRPEAFLQGLGGGLGNGQSSSNATKAMGQKKFKEGVHAVSPHCFCSTNHAT